MVSKIHSVFSRRIQGMLKALGILALLTAVAVPALAHHSYAMFDSEQEVTQSGVVKRFLWTNPHSILIVSMPNANGELTDYYFEANGPGYLARNGWSRESVKPGDEITVVSHPLRDPDGAGGDLLTVTTTNGTTFYAKPGASAPTQADQGEN
jgi:hypothetical protein